MSIEGLPAAPPPDDLWEAPARQASSQPLAEWWPRVGAATIDFFVRLGILLACAGAGALLYLVDEPTGDIGLGFGIAIGYVLALFVYAPLMLARTGGQTVGHRVTDTRIVMADGSRMSGGRGFVREVLVKSILIEGIGAFVFLIAPIVNYLLPLWDKGNEALHDKICDTHVVAGASADTAA